MTIFCIVKLSFFEWYCICYKLNENDYIILYCRARQCQEGFNHLMDSKNCCSFFLPTSMTWPNQSCKWNQLSTLSSKSIVQSPAMLQLPVIFTQSLLPAIAPMTMQEEYSHFWEDIELVKTWGRVELRLTVQEYKQRKSQ